MKESQKFILYHIEFKGQFYRKEIAKYFTNTPGSNESQCFSKV